MIVAYSNASAITYENLKEFYNDDYILNCTMIFCGGLSYSDFRDTFKILALLKEKNPDKFGILLSSYDVSFICSIIELFKFISIADVILENYIPENKSTHKKSFKSDIKKPKNILSFKTEYKDAFDFDELNQTLSSKKKKTLYELSTMLKKYNPYNLDDIITVISNSQIVYDDDNFIFTAENGSLNYESFDQLNLKFLDEFQKIINGESSKFIKAYSRKNKKIMYPKLNKTYIVGDNIKHFDQPYYRADKNVIFLNTRCARREKNNYLNDENYQNKNAYSYIKIDGQNVTVVCCNSKNEVLQGALKFEPAFEIERIENSQNNELKNYAVEVINYVAIPVKGTQTFIMATYDQVTRKEYTISSLVCERKEMECQNNSSSFLTISDLVETQKSILKISDVLQECDSDSYCSRRIIKIKDLLQDNDSVSSKKVCISEKIRTRADSSDHSDIDDYVKELKRKE